MKKQKNVRLSKASIRKLASLGRQYGTETSALEIAIDRMYREEVKMSEKARQFEAAWVEWQADESLSDLDGTGKKWYCRWIGQNWEFAALEPQHADDEWWDISVAEKEFLQ